MQIFNAKNFNATEVYQPRHAGATKKPVSFHSEPRSTVIYSPNGKKDAIDVPSSGAGRGAIEVGFADATHLRMQCSPQPRGRIQEVVEITIPCESRTSTTGCK